MEEKKENLKFRIEASIFELYDSFGLDLTIEFLQDKVDDLKKLRSCALYDDTNTKIKKRIKN